MNADKFPSSVLMQKASKGRKPGPDYNVYAPRIDPDDYRKNRMKSTQKMDPKANTSSSMASLKTVKSKEVSWTHRANNSALASQKPRKKFKMLRSNNTKSSAHLGLNPPSMSVKKEADKRLSFGERTAGSAQKNGQKKEEPSNSRTVSKEGKKAVNNSPETRSIKMNEKTKGAVKKEEEQREQLIETLRKIERSKELNRYNDEVRELNMRKVRGSASTKALHSYNWGANQYKLSQGRFPKHQSSFNVYSGIPSGAYLQELGISEKLTERDSKKNHNGGGSASKSGHKNGTMSGSRSRSRVKFSEEDRRKAIGLENLPVEKIKKKRLRKSKKVKRKPRPKRPTEEEQRQEAQKKVEVQEFLYRKKLELAEMERERQRLEKQEKERIKENLERLKDDASLRRRLSKKRTGSKGKSNQYVDHSSHDFPNAMSPIESSQARGEEEFEEFGILSQEFRKAFELGKDDQLFGAGNEEKTVVTVNGGQNEQGSHAMQKMEKVKMDFHNLTKRLERQFQVRQSNSSDKRGKTAEKTEEMSEKMSIPSEKKSTERLSNRLKKKEKNPPLNEAKKEEKKAEKMGKMSPKETKKTQIENENRKIQEDWIKKREEEERKNNKKKHMVKSNSEKNIQFQISEEQNAEDKEEENGEYGEEENLNQFDESEEAENFELLNPEQMETQGAKRLSEAKSEPKKEEEEEENEPGEYGEEEEEELDLETLEYLQAVEAACIYIQKIWRGYRTRVVIGEFLRELYEEYQEEEKMQNEDVEDLEEKGDEDIGNIFNPNEFNPHSTEEIESRPLGGLERNAQMSADSEDTPLASDAREQNKFTHWHGGFGPRETGKDLRMKTTEEKEDQSKPRKENSSLRPSRADEGIHMVSKVTLETLDIKNEEKNSNKQEETGRATKQQKQVSSLDDFETQKNHHLQERPLHHPRSNRDPFPNCSDNTLLIREINGHSQSVLTVKDFSKEEKLQVSESNLGPGLSGRTAKRSQEELKEIQVAMERLAREQERRWADLASMIRLGGSEKEVEEQVKEALKAIQENEKLARDLIIGVVDEGVQCESIGSESNKSNKERKDDYDEKGKKKREKVGKGEKSDGFEVSGVKNQKSEKENEEIKIKSQGKSGANPNSEGNARLKQLRINTDDINNEFPVEEGPKERLSSSGNLPENENKSPEKIMDSKISPISNIEPIFIKGRGDDVLRIILGSEELVRDSAKRISLSMDGRIGGPALDDQKSGSRGIEDQNIFEEEPFQEFTLKKFGEFFNSNKYMEAILEMREKALEARHKSHLNHMQQMLDKKTVSPKSFLSKKDKLEKWVTKERAQLAASKKEIRKGWMITAEALQHTNRDICFFKKMSKNPEDHHSPNISRSISQFKNSFRLSDDNENESRSGADKLIKKHSLVLSDPLRKVNSIDDEGACKESGLFFEEKIFKAGSEGYLHQISNKRSDRFIQDRSEEGSEEGSIEKRIQGEERQQLSERLLSPFNSNPGSLDSKKMFGASLPNGQRRLTGKDENIKVEVNVFSEEGKEGSMTPLHQAKLSLSVEGGSSSEHFSSSPIQTSPSNAIFLKKPGSLIGVSPKSPGNFEIESDVGEFSSEKEDEISLKMFGEDLSSELLNYFLEELVIDDYFFSTLMQLVTKNNFNPLEAGASTFLQEAKNIRFPGDNEALVKTRNPLVTLSIALENPNPNSPFAPSFISMLLEALKGIIMRKQSSLNWF